MHWNVAKRVLRYIKGTTHFGIVLEKNDNFMLTSFTEAKWEGDMDDRKPTTSYAFTLNNGLISWTSKIL